MSTEVEIEISKASRFHPAKLACLDPTRIPEHIAIIPDGNRRWARKRLFSVQEGHRIGADTLMESVKAAQELGIKVMTFFAFSTENWMRPPLEVAALMMIFTNFLCEQREEMVRLNIKLETIGDLTPFPKGLKTAIADSKAATEDCDKTKLVLAFNYGARNELCRAFKSMLEDYDHKLISKEEINEKMISNYLDTAHLVDPDLLIRTSGEMRISNYLLWQISYAEIHISPVLWPDFTSHHLLDAVLDFQKRERRRGGD